MIKSPQTYVIQLQPRDVHNQSCTAFCKLDLDLLILLDGERRRADRRTGAGADRDFCGQGSAYAVRTTTDVNTLFSRLQLSLSLSLLPPPPLFMVSWGAKPLL